MLKRLTVVLACFWTAACASLPDPPSQRLHYDVRLDERAPTTATFTLRLPPHEGLSLVPARNGPGHAVGGLFCNGFSLRPDSAGGYSVPAGCRTLRWRATLVDHDRGGVDASLPPSAWSASGRFWLLAERHGWLRPAARNIGGAVTIRSRWRHGSSASSRYDFPNLNQPPFYAVIGTAPSERYKADGFTLAVYGEAPGYPWMDALHGDVLAAWARWREDVIPPGEQVPDEIAFAWLKPTADLEPGYSASAGAASIFGQLLLRPGDPEGEAKARAVVGTSLAHEGFHTIVGAPGQVWPAWVGESLANHFAIEAARRFLSPGDFALLEQLYLSADFPIGLLAAQAAYEGGDGEQGYVFYSKGARFWRAIEEVLTSRANGSGRLAALIQDSNNFAGLAWSDAAAVAAFLDARSDGGAGPVVRCYLLSEGCREPD